MAWYDNDEPGEIPNHHLGLVRWYLFLPPSTLGKNRNIKKIKNTSDLVKLLTSTVIALKTPPRLEKERAPQRKSRPLHRLKNLGGILRILLGSKSQEMQLSSGSAKMGYGIFSP